MAPSQKPYVPPIAHENREFLESPEARPLRILAEYLDPLVRLRREDVADTIVMFGSAVCSQIAAEELTFAASFIQSRSFRAFEVYFVATGIYLALALLLRQGMRLLGQAVIFRRAS